MIERRVKIDWRAVGQLTKDVIGWPSTASRVRMARKFEIAAQQESRPKVKEHLRSYTRRAKVQAYLYAAIETVENLGLPPFVFYLYLHGEPVLYIGILSSMFYVQKANHGRMSRETEVRVSADDYNAKS